MTVSSIKGVRKLDNSMQKNELGSYTPYTCTHTHTKDLKLLNYLKKTG
jgi:hypothetical protein